jgi:hypothetical protein
MDLQLELLSYHYYNTLGFDAELIDYSHCIRMEDVLQLIQESAFGCITYTLHARKSPLSAN